ncbi:MAG: flagellar export chaperone FliS [Treponema sp.]
MGYTEAYTAYQKANVTTASQGHLIVLLYEAAVKNMEAAAALIGAEGKIKAGDIERFGILIQKTQAIVTELQVSLDMEKGGNISKNLMSLYVFFNSELTDANINHDKAKIDSVREMMKQLLDSWQMASNSTANTAASPSPQLPTLNIEG